MTDELLGTSTVKRRKAILSLLKQQETVDCGVLLQALALEEGSTNSWETKAALMVAIGVNGCKDCADHLWNRYVLHPSSSALVDMRAGCAYVRLQRADLTDGLPVLQVLEGGYAASMEGALEALGYDRMVPPLDIQTRILEKCWDFGTSRARGLTDPRYGLAAACAGWKAPLVESFLRHCLASKDTPLEYVAEKSLKGKYVRLR